MKNGIENRAVYSDKSLAETQQRYNRKRERCNIQRNLWDSGKFFC